MIIVNTWKFNRIKWIFKIDIPNSYKIMYLHDNIYKNYKHYIIIFLKLLFDQKTRFNFSIFTLFRSKILSSLYTLERTLISKFSICFLTRKEKLLKNCGKPGKTRVSQKRIYWYFLDNNGSRNLKCLQSAIFPHILNLSTSYIHIPHIYIAIVM